MNITSFESAGLFRAVLLAGGRGMEHEFFEEFFRLYRPGIDIQTVVEQALKEIESGEK
jgi:hypothetical protein